MMAEEVAGATGVTLPAALSALVALEVRGLIQGEGGRYRATADGADQVEVPEHR
jgi:predicted Rossmann fold nucleotide-binding protein DprA/Smf involved in DNA uptake